jgi:hypothetical protein
VVPRAAAAAGRADRVHLRPTFRSVLGRGLPGFLREGFLPLGAFYAALQVSGLSAGIVAGGAASLAVYAFERRAGRDGLLVRLSLLFVAVQTAVGLATHSAVAYLAMPVLVNAAWGLVFLGSVAVGRPLAGALACAWYPFPPAFRQSAVFKRVYGVESIVWGVYFLARSAVRLGVLAEGANLAVYLLVVFGTGTPLMLALLAWSVWYAIRRFSAEDAAAPPPATPAAAPYLGSASSL